MFISLLCAHMGPHCTENLRSRAGLQLRQRKDKVYIPYKLSSKVIDWKPRWLYIANQGETLPVITPGPPIQRPKWNNKPVDDSQIPELLDRIASMRPKHITGDDVIFDWMKRRIQPLQARETLGFQYQGASDLSRYSKEEIFNGEDLVKCWRSLSTHFIPCLSLIMA